MGRGYQHFFDVSLQMDSRLYPIMEEPYEMEAKAVYLSNELKAANALGSLAISKVIFVKLGESNAPTQSAHSSVSSSQIATPRSLEIPSNVPPTVLKRSCDEMEDCNAEKKARVAADVGSVSGSLELQYCDFLQAQCITGKHKPKVLLCRSLLNDAIVAIKGPVSKTEANQLMGCQRLKEILDVANTNYRIQDFTSGRLINMNGMCIISDCKGLIDGYDMNKFIVRTTSLETEVKISTNKIDHWSHDCMENIDDESEMSVLACNCLLQLAFRKVVGTNDTCCRNLVIDRKNKTVVSIDDPALFRETPYMFKISLNKTLSSNYKAMLDLNWSRIRGILVDWSEKLKTLTMDQLIMLKEWGIEYENISFSLKIISDLLKKENWKF